ncbi:hypothetical protein N8633_00820 [bacterium]|jgi:hypothetical protein|nr:hypothetical protein [Verrucomicrobiota bacterium]MDA7667495.1 hypothetical protein [bacterium]MDA7680308.1 hypothetical protein [bacterium]
MIQSLKSNLKSLLGSTSIFSSLAVFCSLALNASDFSIKPLDKAPPSSLGESIKAELSDKALVILQKDKPIYELWLRKELILKSPITSPAKALTAVTQASLLGAITVVSDERDYRDDELYKGVYTIRFGLRPEDGNHLGTSDHLFFAVLIDAKNDQELGKIVKTKQLVKASSKTSATDHPMILSLFPVTQSDAVTPSIHEPAPEHEAIRLSIPSKSQDGKNAGSVVFDLVVAGMADF